MSPQTPSTFTTLWFRWKALKLPWRKRVLKGLDLQGNTFWEFADALSADKHRMRRIVQYPPSTHYSEIKISPQWHQWLRHTRHEPPSLVEQSQDLVRQRNLKVLAAQADARWAAKPSFLDSPEKRQPLPATQIEDSTAGRVEGDAESMVSEQAAGHTVAQDGNTQKTQVADGNDRLNERLQQEEKKPNAEDRKKDDPWKNVRAGPSEEWQPSAWTGNIAPRR
ncbi:uncharacterized protein RAG0_13083 [Rhynchosporium agropyri]|uniref:Uncharacterized protein n=2 Tax=Rhynchosporium TaxID=38037 RepID=A0A1E1MKQ0_RHYSE|nr:uncharacterized protein RAG0_13083 [Rhynchosporium agropyri]CZT49636.1 uncharacterized protein RSE6_10514 [Rhynchosporium secalis]